MSGGNDPKKKDPALVSATFVLRNLLKGDLLNTLPRVVDAQAVEQIWKEAHHRLAQGALWILSAGSVERVEPDAHAALRHVFGEFRKGGGAKIVVSTADAQVAEFVRAAAKGFVSLDLQVLATYNEALAVGKAYRDARDKKPQ